MLKLALLTLEDGSYFIGKSIGAEGEVIGEVVFNTSITGYQEIITDPSYFHQIVVFTYPHIGNTGVNEIDKESKKIQVKAIVIKSLSLPSNFRKKTSIVDYIKSQNIIGISDIDTRKLTRLIRNNGVQNGCIITYTYQNIHNIKIIASEKLRRFSGLNNMNLIKMVSTEKKYIWNQGSYILKDKKYISIKKKYNIVVYDYGVKRNIMRMLVDRGCVITVVPEHTKAKTSLNMNPDGIFLSNGPGNPMNYIHAINNIKYFLSINIPIFGICLGHQLLALASGAKTIKMKFGHRGNNHPVKDIINNKVIITSQNHGFVVDKDTLPKSLKITHISLIDGTIQGQHRIDKLAFSFQGHPEASPGPHDASYLFDHFIELIEIYRNRK